LGKKKSIEDEFEVTELKIKEPKKTFPPIYQNEEDPNIGPGQYDPQTTYTKKQYPATGWSLSKSTRLPNNAAPENPGPANYNQQHESISRKMMKGILQQENLEDKNKGQQNYHRLV
jgi:hypothetical protein